MKLRQVDKNRYRKNYKIVFAAITLELIVVSLTCSTLLIGWLSTPEESHLFLNFVGVAFAALLACYALYHFRDHPFMDEVVYVWSLKKQLNQIYRKQRKIEPLIEDSNVEAMVIMNYMYQGSMQLYELDDNTITMGNLKRKSAHLKSKIEEQKVSISTDDYQRSMLAQF